MPHDLYVFGSNGEGQLGEGIPVADIVSKPTRLPRIVASRDLFGDVKEITCGDNHTLFLFTDSSLAGVGQNNVGQMLPDCEGPIRLTRLEQLHENVHFCAATCESSAVINTMSSVRSAILTKGRGQWGELGRGEEWNMSEYNFSDPHYLKERLPGVTIDFAAGVWHYVAIQDDGSVYGWGKARLGQLGEKLSDKVTTPTKIEDVPFRPLRVVCGKDFTYLVSDPSTGEHKVLGKDKFNIVSAMPPDVKGYKDIGATWHAIFVLFNDGRLAAWGKENQWKLLPPGLPPIDKIAVGTDHILTVTKEGKLISWGWAKHGNCGDLSNVQQEIKNDMVNGFWNEIDIPGKITKVAAGYCTSFVITEVEENEPSPKKTKAEK
ncbi:alpha-tubulin suppressor protein-like protein Aats1 [Macroventuria anomochaeta]|uniref:Alpha-tubulin suppressor protein-like protein Aats1 n=1 Tax=Macroventuria anomochaeta TaxID=301207 RepID=A0ACB6SK46_9PLEO|nr:alpha-tubulin suppressor protein-like protein Aats1 [Macroventuria anomochaeta]KAF2633969.1 alpha-tubulin suppressor protein-like protein Aats1 [Macroventuria anomochaeta]